MLFCTARNLLMRIGMLDLLFIVATMVFFLISLAYVRGCERL